MYVHLRACRTLHRLFLLDSFRSRLESLSVSRRFLLPALVEVFIDSERGKENRNCLFMYLVVSAFMHALVAAVVQQQKLSTCSSSSSRGCLLSAEIQQQQLQKQDQDQQQQQQQNQDQQQQQQQQEVYCLFVFVCLFVCLCLLRLLLRPH